MITSLLQSYMGHYNLCINPINVKQYKLLPFVKQALGSNFQRDRDRQRERESYVV